MTAMGDMYRGISTGVGKVGLSALAYPFAAAGTGIRKGVAGLVGAPTPTDTAAEAVAAFGASGLEDISRGYGVGSAGAKGVLADMFGLQPAPIGVQPPAAAPPPPSTVSSNAANTIARTPLDSESAPASAAPTSFGTAAPNYTPQAATPVRQTEFNDFNTRGVTRAGVTQPQVAQRVPQPTMNPAVMQQQTELMNQINAAKSAVAAGDKNWGYKHGDITRNLALISALSPLVSSTNNLAGNMYGADAGMASHAMDNAAKIGITEANNQNELVKTRLAGDYGIYGKRLGAEADIKLAERKAQLEAGTPAGQKALMEALKLEMDIGDLSLLDPQSRLWRSAPNKPEQIKDAAGNLVGGWYGGEAFPMSQASRDELYPPSKDELERRAKNRGGR